MPTWEVICGDCLEVMRGMEAGSFDAVVTDPPYGIGEARRRNETRGNLAAAKPYPIEAWDDDPPECAVFEEMIRVSKEQVVFGANHFADRLPASPSWIVWDKDNNTNDFADCELAWTSHHKAVRKIRWRWNGMLQEPNAIRETRYHRNQKPVPVMSWILENYTPDRATILDPFCGSGTTGVACVKTGRNFVGIEINPDYCNIARKRIAAAAAEPSLFANVSTEEGGA